jgi:hypothetical protein
LQAHGYEATDLAMSIASGEAKFFRNVGLWILPVALRGRASTNGLCLAPVCGEAKPASSFKQLRGHSFAISPRLRASFAGKIPPF